MYLLLNNDEVSVVLAKEMLARHLKKIECQYSETTAYIKKITKKMAKTNQNHLDFEQLATVIASDIQKYKNKIVSEYKFKYRLLVNWLANNIDSVEINRADLIDMYIKHSQTGFVKTVGLQLTDHPRWLLRNDLVSNEDPILIRNILHNEQRLANKLQNNKPFWFIDSGYTNFLNRGRKTWHRLTKNHIHHRLPMAYYPADRLYTLPSFPDTWRTGGHKILVVESSESHYRMFGDTIDAWRNRIKQELDNYPEFEVTYRPKETNKKIRSNLYEQLKNDPSYYCVISDASAAAVEAIWAGIPVITLGQHITNPVSKSSVADIKNLYRGPIGDWLCALTYNQWTLEELYNGTALTLLRKYCYV